MKAKPTRDPDDSPPAVSESQMIKEVALARAQGRVLRGPVTARVASRDEIADAEVEAEYMARLRRAGDSSVPVTIRMPANLMIQLRTAADRAGVPYQAMIKDLIQHHLEQSATVTVSELEKAMEPLQGLFRSKLQASDYLDTDLPGSDLKTKKLGA